MVDTGNTLKVLHVVYQSIPDIQGSSIRTKEMLSSLKNAGCEQKCITSPFQRGVKESRGIEVIDGIPFLRTYLDGFSVSQGYKGVWIRVKKAMTLPYFLTRVYRFAKENNFDLIHAHATLYCFIPALLVGRILGVPVICEVRSIWGNEAASKSLLITLQHFLITQIEWSCLKRSNLTFFLNKRLSDHIDPLGKLNSSISPNGISYPSSLSFRPTYNCSLEKKTEVIFGYVGGLNLYENVEILIEAVDVLCERGLRVKLLIYGHGPMSKELERVSAGKGFVSIMGKFRPEERESIYDSLDVVVYPRISTELTETVTPLKPLEAALFGVKIVASSIGGHTDLLKTDGITWCKPDDLDSLVTALETVIELSPSTLTADVASVFQFVTDNHDWNKLGFILLEKYKRLVADS